MINILKSPYVFYIIITVIIPTVLSYRDFCVIGKERNNIHAFYINKERGNTTTTLYKKSPAQNDSKEVKIYYKITTIIIRLCFSK